MPKLIRYFAPAALMAERDIGRARRALAETLSVAEAELFAPTRRKASIAFARHVGMYLMHVVCGFSLSAVARCFGRDRTTVGHAVRNIEDARSSAAFDSELERCGHALKSCMRKMEELDD